MDMPLRVVLLGKTGVGKSALGNYILQRKTFRSSSNPCAVTQEPMSASAVLDNIHMTVVDNPGLYSDDHSLLKTAIAIQDSLQNVCPGPHVFLVVIKLGRYTQEDADTIDLLKIMFGPDMLQHGIIIFTHEDQAANDGQNINVLINQFADNPKRKALLDGCGKRYLTVNCYEGNGENTTEKLKNLVQMIRLVSHNGRKCYMEDIEVYRRVLVRYAKKWTNSRLRADKMQVIWQKQMEEKQKQVEAQQKQMKAQQERIKAHKERIEQQEKQREEDKRTISILQGILTVGAGVALWKAAGPLTGQVAMVDGTAAFELEEAFGQVVFNSI